MIRYLLDYLKSDHVREAAKKAARTFAYAFLGILVPGLLGWLHALTEWAQAQGQQPFPDATGLVYLAVAAIGAGVIAVVNLLGILLEDATGVKPLRDGTSLQRNEGGFLNLHSSPLTYVNPGKDRTLPGTRRIRARLGH